jgi:helicase MOV-10
MSFEDTKLKQKFYIARFVKAVVGNEEEYNRLQPVAPYVPRKRSSRDPETEIVPGDPPETLNAIPYVVKLAQSSIPERLVRMLSTRDTLASMLRQVRIILPPNFEAAAYGRYFKTALWVEEHRSE